MTKLITITTIISLLYFSYMKYFTTHEVNEADFILMVFASLLFGAWMVAAIVVADELTKREDKKTSEKSC